MPKGDFKSLVEQVVKDGLDRRKLSLRNWVNTALSTIIHLHL